MRRLVYSKVRDKWKFYNRRIFFNRLRPTKIYITASLKGEHEGWIWSNEDSPRVGGIGLNCAYLDNDTWEGVLLHEMIHQWQWEVEKTDKDWLPHNDFPAWQEILQEMGFNEKIL